MKYVNGFVKNCSNHLKTKMNGKYTLPKNAENPFKSGCDPPVGISPVLNSPGATYYQSLIGMLRLMVEIICNDTATKRSILSPHLAYLRDEHMEDVLHSMTYLR